MSRHRSPSRKWRSPKEVLFIKEEKEHHPRHIDTKPMLSAYETLAQENIELKALVEILKAKNKADSSKHLEMGIKFQEREVQIEENYRLIARLQKDLQNCNRDVTSLTAQLEHKRKLFVKLQDSLQTSVNECIELRHLLEASHLETASLDKKSRAEIENLEDRLTLQTSRATNAESRYTAAQAALTEAQTDFRFRTSRSATGVLYLSCLAAYKRIMSRGLHQWRACTAAAVALDAQRRLDARHRDEQRTAHSAALAAQTEQHQATLLVQVHQVNVLQSTTESLRERLLAVKARGIWGNEGSLRCSMFGAWRGALLRKVTRDRDELGDTVSRLQEQLEGKKAELRAASERLGDVQASMHNLKTRDRLERALDTLHRVAAQGRCRTQQIKRAFGCWLSRCLLQRTTALARKEVQRIANNNKQMDKNFQHTLQKYKQCHQHNKKLYKKVDAYRNITSSLATVMRYHSIIYRCFSSWKQYSFEAKIKRVGTWPELWRLSKLTPDSNKNFSDVMHESADLQARHQTEISSMAATPLIGSAGEGPVGRYGHGTGHGTGHGVRGRGGGGTSVAPDDNKSDLTRSSSASTTSSSPQLLLHHYGRAVRRLSHDRSDAGSVSTVSDLDRSAGSSSSRQQRPGSRAQRVVRLESPESQDEPVKRLQHQARNNQLQYQQQQRPLQREKQPTHTTSGSGPGSARSRTSSSDNESSGRRRKPSKPAATLQDLLLNSAAASGGVDLLEGAIEDDIDFDDYYDSQQLEQHEDARSEEEEDNASYNDESCGYGDEYDAEHRGDGDGDEDEDEEGDLLSEAMDLESSYGTHRSQLTSTGGSYSGGSLAFSGTLGGSRLGHSGGGLSATGDFSLAVALNATPSQEYLHLLSPKKRTGDDRKTRENTRSNRHGGGVRDSKDGLGADKSKVRSSSLTFDSATLELKLDDHSADPSGDNAVKNGSCHDSNDQDDDSLGFDVTSSFHKAAAARDDSGTGDYSHALSMFSPK